MDLIGVLAACVRRWWVFVPIVALTAWLCAQQYEDASPQFTSTAAVVIAPSDSLVYVRGNQTDSGVVVTSPFNGGNGERVLAGLLARALNTATVRQDVLPGGGVALQAERDVQTDTNVVFVTVVADDGPLAATAVETVVTEANGVLAEVQRGAGVKDGQYFDAVNGGPIDPPTVTYPDRVRGVVGIGLGGVLLAVVLSVLAQSLIKSRTRRRGWSKQRVDRPDTHREGARERARPRKAVVDVGSDERSSEAPPAQEPDLVGLSTDDRSLRVP